VTRFPSRRLPQQWNLGQHLFPNRSQPTVASRSSQAREKEGGGAVLLAPFPCDGSFECSRSLRSGLPKSRLVPCPQNLRSFGHSALPLSLGHLVAQHLLCSVCSLRCSLSFSLFTQPPGTAACFPTLPAVFILFIYPPPCPAAACLSRLCELWQLVTPVGRSS
jgi:hypothetical protein